MNNAKALGALAWKCSACGVVSLESFDACPACGTWGSAFRAIVPHEGAATRGRGRRVLLADAKPRPIVRIDVPEPWQTALGGGLAAGSSVLVDGRPKCGKTTEVLRLACGVPGALFIPCEPGQDASTLRAITDREGLDAGRLYVTEGCAGLADVLAALAEPPAPPLIVVDSLSMLGDLDVWSSLRKATEGSALVCIMHVTKMGRMAGRNVLRHAVDTIVRVTKTSLQVSENRNAAGPGRVTVKR